MSILPLGHYWLLHCITISAMRQTQNNVFIPWKSKCEYVIIKLSFDNLFKAMMHKWKATELVLNWLNGLWMMTNIYLFMYRCAALHICNHPFLYLLMFLVKRKHFIKLVVSSFLKFVRKQCTRTNFPFTSCHFKKLPTLTLPSGFFIIISFIDSL